MIPFLSLKDVTAAHVEEIQAAVKREGYSHRIMASEAYVQTENKNTRDK